MCMHNSVTVFPFLLQLLYDESVWGLHAPEDCAVQLLSLSMSEIFHLESVMVAML